MPTGKDEPECHQIKVASMFDSDDSKASNYQSRRTGVQDDDGESGNNKPTQPSSIQKKNNQVPIQNVPMVSLAAPQVRENHSSGLRPGAFAVPGVHVRQEQSSSFSSEEEEEEAENSAPPAHARDDNISSPPPELLEAVLVNDQEQEQMRRDLEQLQEAVHAIRQAPIAQQVTTGNDGQAQQKRRFVSVTAILLVCVLVIAVAVAVPLATRNGTSFSSNSEPTAPPSNTGANGGAPAPTDSLQTSAPTSSTPTMYWAEEERPLLGRNPSDNFGMSVALSDDARWIVGGGQGYAELLRLFDRLEKSWHDIESDGDFTFGVFLALSADGYTLAVGAADHVKIYHLSLIHFDYVGGTYENRWVWRECWQCKISGPDDSSTGFFGWAIELSRNGTIVAVGDSRNSNGGQVQVFRKRGSNWNSNYTQYGQTLNGDSSFDDFGHSLAISDDGNVLAVGSPGENEENPGYVKVFQFDDSAGGNEETLEGGAWVSLGQDRILNDDATSHFGDSVRLSSDGAVLAVSGRALTGFVTIYKLEESERAFEGPPVQGGEQGDRFGESIAWSADGRTLIVSAPGSDDNGKDSGHIRIFELT